MNPGQVWSKREKKNKKMGEKESGDGQRQEDEPVDGDGKNERQGTRRVK